MKEYLKREAPLFVTASCMTLMSLLVLEVFMCFGMFSKNKGLVATIIQMFLFTAMIAFVILLVSSGKAMMRHLRDENYYRVNKAAGDSSAMTFIKLTALYSVILFVIGGLYILLLGLDIMWSTGVFPEEKKGISDIWNTMFPGPNSGAVIATTVLELLTIAFLFTTLVFFCVTIAYNLFTKSRYAGILAALFFAMLGYFLVKLNLQLLGSFDTLTYHLASAGFCIVVTAILFVVTLASLKKHNWKSE